MSIMKCGSRSLVTSQILSNSTSFHGFGTRSPFFNLSNLSGDLLRTNNMILPSLPQNSLRIIPLVDQWRTSFGRLNSLAYAMVLYHSKVRLGRPTRLIWCYLSRWNLQNHASATTLVSSIFGCAICLSDSILLWTSLGMPGARLARRYLMINRAMTTSSYQQRAGHFLVSNGVAGIMFITRYHLDGRYRHMCTTLWDSRPPILSAPLASHAPCISMIDIMVKFRSPMLLQHTPPWKPRMNVTSRPQAAIFLVAYYLIRLGYFLGLRKSILSPQKVVPYLGFLSDSSRAAFRLLPEKKGKLLHLIRETVSCSVLFVKTLQRLVGKCVSLHCSPWCIVHTRNEQDHFQGIACILFS